MDNDTDYYGNVSPAELLCEIPPELFRRYVCIYDSTIHDTYFCGVTL